MVLIVPDEFRDEVLASSEEDLNGLLAAGIAFADRKVDMQLVRRRLEEAGWSPGFSDWYATRIETDGPNIELRVRPKSRYQEDAETYERACSRKTNLTRIGWGLVACSIIIRVVLSAVSSSVSESSDDIGRTLTTGLIGFVLWLADLILGFKGLFMILDAKGQNRWWALVGVFVVFVKDLNVLIPPSKTSDFVREEGAVLSDW